MSRVRHHQVLTALPDEQHRCYLFVAIDRATRWVDIEIRAHKSAQDADAFLSPVQAHTLFKIKTILADNDIAFTDRFSRPKSNIPLVPIASTGVVPNAASNTA